MLLWKGSLDGRLRELMIMRIGWRTASEYEWTQHWRVARMMNVEEGDLLAVRDWHSGDRFGPVERAVLTATDETLDTGTISAVTWEQCAVHLPVESLLELVVAIGNWRMFSSLLRSLDVPLEDGVAPWPPDGVTP
jgi:alkylhydroperoxidase family enzyme